MADELRQPLLQVQVCYALPESVFLVDQLLPAGSTIHDAISASGALQRFPQLDVTRLRVGVFGKLKNLQAPLQQGDRVEIYRPLQADPMESRRRRAAHKSGR